MVLGQYSEDDLKKLLFDFLYKNVNEKFTSFGLFNAIRGERPELKISYPKTQTLLEVMVALHHIRGDKIGRERDNRVIRIVWVEEGDKFGEKNY